jgi:hypothetical protein
MPKEVMEKPPIKYKDSNFDLAWLRIFDEKAFKARMLIRKWPIWLGKQLVLFYYSYLY